jgi:hypothetical protein
MPKNEEIEAAIEGNELVIRIPLGEPRPSSSGKTTIIASTGGGQASTARFQGKPVVVNASAYVK